eukprot:TRINITY_DN734_c0_g1_i3.p1 TRINITY_DN734_c0_g1~~TRINITY_DN734_c0_g1_i3.p1  ORF type:complete len:135 (+),score=0.34 TRINITY_DN734_c0_g1_i3:159-563(+)
MSRNMTSTSVRGLWTSFVDPQALWHNGSFSGLFKRHLQAAAPHCLSLHIACFKIKEHQHTELTYLCLLVLASADDWQSVAAISGDARRLGRLHGDSSGQRFHGSIPQGPGIPIPLPVSDRLIHCRLESLMVHTI